MQKLGVFFRLVAVGGLFLLVMPLLASTPDEVSERPSAWETICLNGTASAACDKASSILSEKLVVTDDQKNEAYLRERLVRVSRRGCESGRLASCAELVGADDGKEHLLQALTVAQKTCSAHPDPASAACKRLNEWQSAADEKKATTVPEKAL